ncbi:hypothetical protein [Streptomyces sp. NEAU-W12]|uniref:hypothetical protein n=1 Tax=Streptomyces sp. NEAU-W12 TaxID=2994668 RepID=UPI00224AB2AC|nr:hypothetical protein [Streptomyces sp. NEAU-W12]MCX2927327.1 hypothetical protein [Streptomyces sp. NEAU-W12]
MDLSPRRSSLSEGVRDEGREREREQGLEKGRAQDRAEDVLLVLEQRGLEVSDAVRTRGTSCPGHEVLRAWLTRALAVSEAEETFAGE